MQHENSVFREDVLKFELELTHRALNLLYGSLPDAEDLVQDTLMRALRYEEKFEKGTNLRAWLHTMMYHLFVNSHRKKKTLSSTLEILRNDPDFISEGYYLGARMVDPFKALELEGILEILREDLSPSHYAILEAIDLQEMTYQEAAEEFELVQGTVMSRLFRARKNAREILKKQYSKPTLIEYFGREVLEDEA